MLAGADIRGTTSRPMGLLQRRLHLDAVLLLPLLALAGLGLVVLYSAFGQELDAIRRQGLRLGVAFGAMVALAQVPPWTLRRWTPWLFGAGVLLLGAVLLVGVEAGGAHRWLDLKLVRFQPSEVMKLALPMAVSALLARETLPPGARATLLSLGMITLSAVLVALQPDLGTAVLVTAAGLFALYLAGLRWRVIGGTALLAAATAPALWFFGMRDYQQGRVLTFLDPERDPLGAGYHIIQSKIAIGSGGVYGKGWLNGTQSHLNFLPEQHTDFVFAVLSEEFGLAGVALLLGLYLAVVARGLYIAQCAQDTFSRLLAGSIALTFFVYVFVNIGMVSGLLPVVGLPLPLISYGGTSLVTILAGFGILMSIHTHRRLWPS